MGNMQDLSNEKRTLRDKLMAVVLLETSKPYKEMDGDLVTECVDFLMELEGKERLTKAEIEQRVKNIPFKSTDNIYSKTKKRFRLKTLAAVAAVLAVLLAVFAAIAVATSYDPVMNLLKEMSYAITDLIDGDSVDVGGVTITKPDGTANYDTLEELLENEKIDILYPTWLPDNEEITSVWFIDDVHSDYYILKCDNATYSITVFLNEAITEEEKTILFLKEINGLMIYYSYFPLEGCSQAIFEYSGLRYSVSAYTEEDLFKIIENLKEIE